MDSIMFRQRGAMIPPLVLERLQAAAREELEDAVPSIEPTYRPGTPFATLDRTTFDVVEVVGEGFVMGVSGTHMCVGINPLAYTRIREHIWECFWEDDGGGAGSWLVEHDGRFWHVEDPDVDTIAESDTEELRDMISGFYQDLVEANTDLVLLAKDQRP